jgi:hypothetical protein
VENCKISYEKHGWVLSSPSTSTSTTLDIFIHPKLYFKALCSKEDSYPVPFYSGIVVKAHSFEF